MLSYCLPGFGERRLDEWTGQLGHSRKRIGILMGGTCTFLADEYMDMPPVNTHHRCDS